ncbi:MAG: peptidylprolyl isomerase [Thermoanaerobaculia bacterium]
MSCRSPLVALFVLIAAGCHSPPRPDAAARVGQEELAYADFEGHLAEVTGSPAAELPQETLSELLDGWVEDHVLRQLADEEGDGVPVEALVSASAEAVTDSDVTAYYRAHAGEYRRPARVDLVQMLLGDREAAERAASHLAAGEDLDDLVESLSSGSSSAQGWRQRSVEERDLPPELARVVFALGDGETSAVIQTDFGFLVFRVDRRIEAGTVPLESVAPEIRSELRSRALESARARLVEEGLRRYDVEVFERNLPFTYRGRFAPSEP